MNLYPNVILKTAPEGFIPLDNRSFLREVILGKANSRALLIIIELLSSIFVTFICNSE